jgi:hypothetical protein
MQTLSVSQLFIQFAKYSFSFFAISFSFADLSSSFVGLAKTHGTGREGFYFSKLFFFFKLFSKITGPVNFFNSILLRVVMFQSWRLEGLLDRVIASPPIPFESGVDF